MGQKKTPPGISPAKRHELTRLGLNVTVDGSLWE
jgi:hypothetical protein